MFIEEILKIIGIVLIVIGFLLGSVVLFSVQWLIETLNNPVDTIQHGIGISIVDSISSAISIFNDRIRW